MYTSNFPGKIISRRGCTASERSFVEFSSTDRQYKSIFPATLALLITVSERNLIFFAGTIALSSGNILYLAANKVGHSIENREAYGGLRVCKIM